MDKSAEETKQRTGKIQAQPNHSLSSYLCFSVFMTLTVGLQQH